LKDAKAMAYVNAYGVLACLENVCDLVDEAKEICAGLKSPVAIGFAVKNGPSFTLSFTKDGCEFIEGVSNCTCKMSFTSPEAFNNLIDNSVPGIPTKNPVQVLTFLLGPFTKLTGIMQRYLQPNDKDMRDPQFFETSTILTMYVIGGAICALGNHDVISRLSASYILDGEISMGITDKVYITIVSRNHYLSLVKDKAKDPRAKMEFKTIELANGLFNGTASTMGELCAGNIYMAGMINMIDNINRILDRVAVYLA